MPKVGKSKQKPTNKNIPQKMICQNPDCEKAGKEQANTNFYNTNSQFLPKYPVCKTCVQKNINVNNIESVLSVLKDMNIAFVKDVWDNACYKSPDNPFGSYIRQINSLPQYKGMKWQDGNKEIKHNKIEEIEFEVTRDMILQWGSNYEPEEYYELEKFYNDMKFSNNIETAQDVAYLKKLAVISLKMDKALQEGNSGEAKQLGDLFSKYMADSKFRAMDKTDADKTGGIRNFGMIYAEVEKDGFIPPWEYYRKIKGISQDIVDKTIMHIENFTLKLNRVEKMTKPPTDTPKLEDYEIDNENKIKINDIEVDTNFDEVDGSDT